MIISHKYKYLFIATPHTGSTAISKALCQNYEGKEILHKHANFYEFKKIALKKYLKYFIFAGVRNPLDEIVSEYIRFVSNHRMSLSNKKFYLNEGGWRSKRDLKIFKMIQKYNLSFLEFVKLTYPYPYIYTNDISLNGHYCDFIIRFENLYNDLYKVFELLNLPKIEELPKIESSITKDKQKFLEYYKNLNPKEIEYIKGIFGPFMVEWHYKLPENWTNKEINQIDLFIYNILKKLRLLYCKSSLLNIHSSLTKDLSYLIDKMSFIASKLNKSPIKI